MTTGELPPELRKIPFRTVISMEVIEHLYSPRTFAAFVRSILEANGGGRFILTTPYHGYLKNLSIALAGKADRRRSGRRSRMETHRDRCRRNSAETVRKRHGGSTRHDAEAARGTARRRQSGGTEVKTHGFSFRGFFSIFVKTNQATR